VTTVALVLGSVALAVSLVALGLTIVVMRQSGETTTDLRMHRRAHTIAHGHADPKLDRRQANIGPPRSTGERRGMTRYPEPRERYAPRPPDHMLEVDEPLTAERADQLRDDVATGELERTDLPTAMLEQQRPEVPRRSS
jgi:hypothetical protein